MRKARYLFYFCLASYFLKVSFLKILKSAILSSQKSSFSQNVSFHSISLENDLFFTVIDFYPFWNKPIFDNAFLLRFFK